MLKRVRWLTAGAAFGFGGALWLQRKLKTAADRFRPVGLAEAAAGRAKGALDEGRAAMREREAELRGGAGKRRPGRP
jgi:hypothetical protein